MTQWSVKKEIIPHGTQISCRPIDGALISFSGMQSVLALFSQSRAFGSFVGTKEQASWILEMNHSKVCEAGVSWTVLQRWIFETSLELAYFSLPFIVGAEVAKT